MTIRWVEGHTEITEEDVRQGQTGVHLRYVLLYSIMIATAGLGLAALIATIW